MNRTQFAAAAALLVGAALITAPAAGADPAATYVYTVRSDSPLTSVSYLDANSNLQILDNQTAPWSLTFTRSGTDGLSDVTGETAGGQVACKISVNGSVKAEKSGAGKAHCSA
jgi:hypothetical protein